MNDVRIPRCNVDFRESKRLTSDDRSRISALMTIWGSLENGMYNQCAGLNYKVPPAVRMMIGPGTALPYEDAAIDEIGKAMKTLMSSNYPVYKVGARYHRDSTPIHLIAHETEVTTKTVHKRLNRCYEFVRDYARV